MKTVVTLSGAGLSQESGIPTFRDSNGLWENHKVEDVASQDGWQRNKELVLNFYKQRFDSIKNCQPNEGHKALAKLQEKYRVINITQNIDDLLERAGCKEIWHLHGTIDSRKCEWHKNISNLDGDNQFKCTFQESGITESAKLGDNCPLCGGQLRPDVVWFGEAVDLNYNAIKDLIRDMKYGDGGAFICVGTSLQVAPASMLVPLFGQVKEKYFVDKKPWNIGNFTVIKGSAAEELPKLVEKLLME